MTKRLFQLGALFWVVIAMAGIVAVFSNTATAVGTPSGKLGCQKTGLYSYACDTQTDLAIYDAGSWQTVFQVSNPVSAFQTHEQMDITALVRFRTAPGGDASTLGGFQLRRMDGQYENGVFTGFGGDASDTLLSSGMGNVWLDSGAQLVQCTALGQTECVQVFCERPCQISLSTSYDVNFISDSGTVDAGDAADAADSGSGPGFTLSGIYLQPAVPTGSTKNIVVTCTAGANPCTSVTSAKMCGTAATVAATSTTSITLTPPANTATNGTTCAITATNSSGTYTLPGCTTGSTCATGLGVLDPAVTHAWYAAQNWNVGAQTWGDLVASENLGLFGASYTTTASWSNGQPAVTGATTTAALFSSTMTQAQPFALFQADTITSGVGANPFTCSGGATASAAAISETANMAVYAGVSTQLTSTAPTYTTPFWHEDYFSAGASFTAINGGAHTVVGTSPGTNGISAGIVLFNNPPASQGQIGSKALAVVFNGTPTTTQETNLSNIALGIYGNSM